MAVRTTRRDRKPRVADEILAGMRELERMMAQGKLPEAMFTAKTIQIPDPGVFQPKAIRGLRESLGVSQAVFARLLGVSAVLVKSWESGARHPSAIARRLLDTIAADPGNWLATVSERAVA